ncbi:hypothetical protein C2W59_02550 [Bacillus pumilus]|uniref:Uncharacterized protein n=1 Tax=Bacillus pumilus TaxID=1408 RepID=A0AB34QZJ2_BACPU|nr:hypothetical protein B4127_3814 [Bacillus pumilus]RAP16039.1 hypothetical protein C2W58_01691 [Bacillus pumilus]RAP23704.1 hypothetical protein C2W59_02550 [Bacillus pumilus]
MPWNTLIAAGLMVGVPFILFATVYFIMKTKNKKSKSSN